MDFEIRPLIATDAAACRPLMAQAFSQGRVVETPAADAPADADDVYVRNRHGVFVGGELQSALTICPFEVHWGAETTLAMGGIAGVATAAEARGKGYVDALLRHTLLTMRDAGQTISALYPFSWSFYRPFGWDWVGESRTVQVPLSALAKFAGPGRTTNVTGASVRDALEPAYTAYARRYRGTMTTEHHRWERLLEHSDGRTSYVYRYAPTGEYLIWRYEPDGKKGTVRRWVAWSAEGYRALLALLHYLGTQCETAEIRLPMDTLLPQFIMHWDLETKVGPVFMGRVVDAARALEKLKPPVALTGRARIRLTDAHAPWNDGVLEIAMEGGAVRCGPVAAGPGDSGIEIDIQAFSQAFWGMPGLQALRAAGRLLVHSEPDFALLDALLPAAPVYTLDFF
jgi:predicted acetyltransferase